MNRSRNRINRMILLLLGFCLMLMPAGCGSKQSEGPSATSVFTFQGKSVSVGEVYVYARTISQDYEKAYGKEIWDMQVAVDDQETDMRALTRKDIIEDIVKVKVLCGRADSFKLSLTNDERERVELETEAFWKNLTDTQIADMELSKDIVKNVLNENMLARKVYQAVINEAGIEVSDEEARMTTVYDMYFPCFEESVNGVLTPMDEESKAEQYDRALQAYNTLISPLEGNAERNVEALAAYYGLQDARYVTESPEDLVKIYGKEVTDMLYRLEDGSYSLVTETEYGYHIFYMDSLTNRVATNAKKERLERERKSKYFASRYDSWLKEADGSFTYDRSVDFEVYNKIEF